MNERLKELVDLLPEWLAVTRGMTIYTGLSREEAIRRAEELRQLIRQDRVSPEDFVLDEDFKDVLHALVFLISDSANDPKSLFVEANDIYSFLTRIEWTDDLFGEKEELLLDCARIGFGSASSSTSAFEYYSHAVEDYIEEARMAAKAYLATSSEERSEEFQKNHLSDPEVLLSICGMLRDQKDVSPATVAKEASAIYRWLARYDGPKKSLHERFGLILSGERRDPSRRRDYFFGDELDYFLGETAFLAGTCYRYLGQRAEALRWLDRAEAGFHHTANSAAGLANVAYARLTVRLEMGRYEDVLDLMPSLLRRYEELGMPLEMAKCRVLGAMALKSLGRIPEALQILEPVCSSAVVKQDRPLYGRIYAELGDLHQLEGRFDAAMTAYRKALPLVQNGGLSVPLATLKMFIGGGLRDQSRLAQAIEAFRAAQQDFRELEMSTFVAYLHLLIAETFLALHHDREAEREILAALPTIEEQKMVPEGFAAVALLRESVRRQKTDPEALRQLREHLQAKG